MFNSLALDLNWLTTLLWVFFFGYSLLMVLFVISENREPKVTYAWILTLIFLPFVGLLIYLFFGRGYKAFGAQKRLTRQHFQQILSKKIRELDQREESIIQRIKTERPRAYKPKILRLVRRNAPSFLTQYNEVEILQDAATKYPRLLQDIRDAQHHIHLLYYIWDEDEFTLGLKDLLIERATAGIEIRILVDTQGLALSNSYINDLRTAGIEFHEYLDYRSLDKIHTAGYRNHRKIAIIDGRVGYVGGMNLSQEHLDGGPYFSCWRDTHTRIAGEATLNLQGIFAISWLNTTGQRLSEEPYFSAQVNSPHFLPVQIVNSGPDSQWAAIRQLYFMMIMSAEERIYLQSPFFIPDESITEALLTAALSGVEIKMMFTPRGRTYQIAYQAAHTYFAQMAKAGIRIFLYERGYFHPKTLTIDGAVCTIGTANMDIRSFSINYETNAVFYDERLAQELETAFEQDLAFCTEWQLADYQQQPAYIHLRDSVYRLFSPLL